MKDGTHCSPLRLGVSGCRAFREQNTKRRITDGWRWKFQSRFAILISCSVLAPPTPWCGFFPFFFFPSFLTRGNAVCREHECEVETFRPDVGCRSRRGEPPRKFSPDLRNRGEVKIVQNQWPRARRDDAAYFPRFGRRPTASNNGATSTRYWYSTRSNVRDILQNSGNARKANNIWKQRSVNRYRCRMRFSFQYNNQKCKDGWFRATENVVVLFKFYYFIYRLHNEYMEE